MSWWWARVLVLWWALGLGPPVVGASPPVSPTPARSGFEDMSPALQRLQRDVGLNPAWLWVEEGRQLWDSAADAQKPSVGPRSNASGTSCRSCHGPIDQMRRVATTHPRWHEGLQRPVALMEQVRHCRSRRATSADSPPGPSAPGGPALGTAGGKVPLHGDRSQGQGQVIAQDEEHGVLALTAALVAAGSGEVITPDRHPRMEAWADRGRELWHQRFGQLNLSCAQCHDQRAGQRLGGTRIPQAHDTGYPLYRMEWQALGPLERRLRGCMSGIRAEPFPPGADEWWALSVYMHRRSAGLLIEAGAIRP